MCTNADLDSINRVKTENEVKLTEYIESNNETCEISDSYRVQVKVSGYTWSRQRSCYAVAGKVL